jgi:hypothetical protein
MSLSLGYSIAAYASPAAAANQGIAEQVHHLVDFSMGAPDLKMLALVNRFFTMVLQRMHHI